MKPGKVVPAAFAPVSTDPATGKTVGWEPIEQSGFAKYHAEAVGRLDAWPPGTYELVGPKINGDPEKVGYHKLIPHAFAEVLDGVPATFDGLRSWLHAHSYEGIVWHHPDGRMAKLKARDFPREVVS